MSPNPEPLPALLARLQAGDEDALAEVLRHYEPRLRLAAHALLGPAMRTQFDSLDLVQSVHRVLIPGLRQGRYDFATGDQLFTLALRVIKNKVIDKWRHLRPESEGRAADTAPSLLPRLPSGRPSDDPEAVVLARDAERRVLEGVAGVDRRLIELRLQGHTLEEIAETLGCDAHALRARMSRLRQRLRDEGRDGGD